MKLTSAHEIEEAPIHWIWTGRIPLGQTTIIEGDPGCGKSQLTLAIASHITRGADWPDGSICEQGKVLIANAEDPPEEVIIPRLKAAEANLENVTIISPSDTGEFTIPDGVEKLHVWAKGKGFRLLLLDPLEAFLNTGVDAYRNHHIRRALRPLEVMAKDLGLSIIIVRHLTKDSNRSAIYRGTGSIGVIGAARAGYNVSRDPADATRSILSPVKGNWAKKPAAIAYKIEEAKWVSKEGEEIVTSRINWDGEVDVQADDLGFQDPTMSPGELSDAIGFLRGDLAEGAKAVRELFGAAARLGINKKALYKAARVMGIVKRKEGFGNDGQWVWELSAAISYGNVAGDGGAEGLLESLGQWEGGDGEE